MDSTYVTVAAGAVVLALLLRCMAPKSNTPLPPGPRGWPIVGCMFEMPARCPWFWLNKLHKQYGPLISYSVLGNVMVSIGDYDLAKEILDRKARATSGRPINHVFDTYVYRQRAVGFQSDTPDMRTGRKIIQPIFNDVKNGGSEPAQRFEAACTIIRILENPVNFRDELQRFAISEATIPLFGARMPTPNEPFIKDLRKVETLLFFANPKCSVINLLPWLDQFLPSLLAPWRKAATDFSNYYTSIGKKAVDYAMEAGSNGITSLAYAIKTNEALQRQIDATTLETEIMTLELAHAATETTWSVLLRFVSAWALYPEAMKAAQIQLDDVVGTDCLPNFEARPKLPQVEAICREVMRWRPPSPLGLPHVTTEDFHIEVSGKTYLIPKGATLLGNAWEMDASRKSITNPDVFDPRNQLNADGTLKPFAASHTAFGWGRRMCAGQPFAERGLYIMISHMLWAFDCCSRGDGSSLHNISEISSGITSVPGPFKVDLKARSETRAAAARREWGAMDKDLF